MGSGDWWVVKMVIRPNIEFVKNFENVKIDKKKWQKAEKCKNGENHKNGINFE